MEIVGGGGRGVKRGGKVARNDHEEQGQKEEELEAGKLSVFSITIPTLPTSGGSSGLVGDTLTDRALQSRHWIRNRS
jgi:hypothetical protein